MAYIQNETPVGNINGSNKLFQSAYAYVTTSLTVYLNGIRQQLNTDFTETNPSNGTFTFGTAPVAGDTILCDYWTTASTWSDNRIVQLVTNAKNLLPSRMSAKLTDDQIELMLWITLQDINNIPMVTSYTLSNVPVNWDSGLYVGSQLWSFMFVAAGRAMEEFNYSGVMSLNIDHFSKVNTLFNKVYEIYGVVTKNVKKGVYPKPVGLGTPQFSSLLIRPYSILYPGRFGSNI